MQQRWYATEKEAYVFYQSVLKLDLCLRGAKCVTYCNHKPLGSFCLRVKKSLRLIGGLWNLPDYNITFFHIKGKKQFMADAISRLKTLKIYKEPLENPKISVVSNTQTCYGNMCHLHEHHKY